MKETNGYSDQEYQRQEGGHLKKAFKPRLEEYSWTEQQNM